MSLRKLSQPGSCYSRKRVIVRVVSLERSILEDERSLLVGKWSTNGNAEGIWDENGTKNRARRGRTESAEEERERGGGKRARRKRKQSEGEGSGWSVVQLWVGAGSELRSRWGKMECVVVYWGQK